MAPNWLEMAQWVVERVWAQERLGSNMSPGPEEQETHSLSGGGPRLPAGPFPCPPPLPGRASRSQFSPLLI